MIDTILPIPSYSFVFHPSKKKSEKTFLIDLFHQRKEICVKTRLTIDPLKIVSQETANQINTAKGTWILCTIKIESEGVIQDLPIYIKKTVEFTPVEKEAYVLFPYVEFSGKTDQKIKKIDLLIAYITLKRMPDYKSYVTKKALIYPEMHKSPAVRKLSANSFSYENRSIPPIGLGSFKAVKLAMKIFFELIPGGISFNIEDHVRIKPKKGLIYQIKFFPAHFSSLSHPHLGIPQASEIFFREKFLKGIQYWQTLRFTEKAEGDLYYNCISRQDELIKAMLQLTLGLNYLHEKNLFHGDLKASNFLFYKNDAGIKIYKIEDLESITFFPTSKIYKDDVTQTLEYANLRLRKQLIDPRNFSLSRSNYPINFKILTNRNEIYFTPAHERNSMGIALAELYINYIKANKILKSSTSPLMENIEEILFDLIRLPVRTPSGLIPNSFLEFRALIEEQLASRSLKEIDAMIDLIPPFSSTIDKLNSLIEGK